jgi:hypothetical protein
MDISLARYRLAADLCVSVGKTPDERAGVASFNSKVNLAMHF